MQWHPKILLIKIPATSMRTRSEERTERRQHRQHRTTLGGSRAESALGLFPSQWRRRRHSEQLMSFAISHLQAGAGIALWPDRKTCRIEASRNTTTRMLSLW